MKTKIHRTDGICIVECTGDLTFGEGDARLRQSFRTLLADGERRFVLDLAGVGYIDSAGVGEIVACAKRAFEHGGLIKLVSTPDGTVRRIVTVTGLDRAFEVFAGRAEAVASFAR